MGFTLLSNLFDNAFSLEVCKTEDITFVRDKILYKDFFCPMQGMSAIYNIFMQKMDSQYMIVFNNDEYFTFSFSPESKKSIEKSCKQINNIFFQNKALDNAAWDALLAMHSYDIFTSIFNKGADIEKKAIQDIYNAICQHDTKGIVERVDQVLEAVMVCAPDSIDNLLSYTTLLFQEFEYLRCLDDESDIDAYVEICEHESKTNSQLIKEYQFNDSQNKITFPHQIERVIIPKQTHEEISSKKDSYQCKTDNHASKCKRSYRNQDVEPRLSHNKTEPVHASVDQSIPTKHRAKTRKKSTHKPTSPELFYSHYMHASEYVHETHYNLTVAAQRAAIQARKNNTYNPYVRIYYTAFETNRRHH